MPNCDFGKPCDCPDCSEKINIQTCSNCNNDVYKIINEYNIDRKGIGYYDYYGLCENHYSIYTNKKNIDEKIRLDYKNTGKNKYDEFIKNIQLIEVELVPIKILKTKKYKINKYGCYNQINKELFNISKINNRWVINKKAVELFLDMGLDEYYCFDKKFIK
jgi:hypothetical protein